MDREEKKMTQLPVENITHRDYVYILLAGFRQRYQLVIGKKEFLITYIKL